MYRWPLFSISVVAFLLLLLPSFQQRSLGEWEAYHMVVIEGDLSAFHDQMSSLPVSEILSAQTAQVSLQTFSRVTTLSVAEIPERLDPLDIRYDPYLQKLPALFQGENGAHIVYVSRDIGRLRLWRELTFRMENISWSLVGFSLLSLILGIVGVITITFILVSRFSDIRLVILLEAVVLGAATLSIPILGIIPLLLMFVGSTYVCDKLFKGMRAIHSEGAIRHLSIWAGFGMLIWSSTLLFLGLLYSGLLIAGLLIVLQQMGAVGIVVYHQYLRIRDTEHPLFTPSYLILSNPLSLKAGSLISASLYLGFLLTVLFLPTAPDMQNIPRIVHNASSTQQNFPTREQYLAHRAFQLTLPFGGSFQVPSPGARVEIPYFLPAASGLQTVKDHLVIMEWTEEWMQEQLEPAAYQAANILLYQKDDVQIASAVSISLEMRSITMALVTLLALIILGFSFFSGYGHGRRRDSLRYWVSFAGLLRTYGK